MNDLYHEYAALPLPDFERLLSQKALDARQLIGIIGGYLDADPRPRYAGIVDLSLLYLGRLQAAEAPPVIRRLLYAEAAYAQYAIRALGEIASPEALSLLLELLDSQESGAFTDKAYLPQALEQIGGQRAADALARCLGPGDTKLDKAVQKAFRAIGHQASPEALCAALEKARGGATGPALAAAEQKGDACAIPLVIPRLVLPRYTRAFAAEVLTKLGEPAYAQIIRGEDGDIDRLLAREGHSRVIGWVCRERAEIESIMKNPYSREPGLAMALAAAGIPAGRGYLLDMLADEEGGVRLAAADRLYSLGEPRFRALFWGDDGDARRFAEGWETLSKRDVIRIYNASGYDMRNLFAAGFLACGAPGLSRAVSAHHKDFPHSDEPLCPVDAEGEDIREPFLAHPADHGESGHFDLEASSYYKGLSDGDF